MYLHTMIEISSFGRYANKNDQKLGRRKKQSFLVWSGKISYTQQHSEYLCSKGIEETV